MDKMLQIAAITSIFAIFRSVAFQHLRFDLCSFNYVIYLHPLFCNGIKVMVALAPPTVISNSHITVVDGSAHKFADSFAKFQKIWLKCTLHFGCRQRLYLAFTANLQMLAC